MTSLHLFRKVHVTLFDFLVDKNLNPKTYPFACGQFPYYSGGSSPIKPAFWYSLYKAISQIPFWKNVIKDENPDIIIVNSKVLCWMGGLCKGKVSVCMVRETIKGNPNSIINRLMKGFLEKFSLVSFLSEYDLNQTKLKKASSVVSPDFLFCENYIDQIGKRNSCDRLGVNPRNFNIAYLGGISRLKGLDLALKAIKICREDNINLIIAGNNISDIIDYKQSGYHQKFLHYFRIRYAKNIKNYIKNNKLQDRVIFVGVQKDVSIIYSACDILIFPMRKPHQARPAFEIGVQRKPVIITDFPNIREFVKDGLNGLVFKPDDPKSLSIAILKLKQDRVLLDKLGQANYNFTLNLHTESFAMQNLMNAINSFF